MKSQSIYHVAPSHSRYDVRVFEKECVSLSKNYDVTLVVGDNKSNELQKKINIVNISFGAQTKIKRIFFNSYKTFRLILKNKPDIVHFHDPEFLPFGFVLRLFGYKVIYDVHENYSLSYLHRKWFKGTFILKAFAIFFNFLEKNLSRSFNAVICVTPEIAALFSTYNRNVEVIYNYPKIDCLTDESDSLSLDNTRVIYAGTLTEFRNIHGLIDATEILNNKFKKSTTLILMGKWHDENYRKFCMERKGSKYVNYKGPQTVELVYNELRKSHIGLNIINENANLRLGLPVKVFEYLLLKIPTLITDFEEWQLLFRDFAYYSTPDDPAIIASKMDEILSNYDLALSRARKGSIHIKDNYSWNLEEKKLQNLYSRLAHH